MKTLILHLKRFSIYSLMFASVGFAACEDENRQDMTPEIVRARPLPKSLCTHRQPVGSLQAFIRYAFRHGFG